MTAEEVFDRTQQPARSRLLVMDAKVELAPYAARPQQVVKKAGENDGLTFLSHPFAAPQTALGDLLPPWTPEDIPNRVSGLEVWNSLSELQGKAPRRLLAFLLSWFPRLARRGPCPQTCQHWDAQLAAGETLTAIAGSGLGGLPNASPRLQHYLLSNLSNHLIVPHPLSGNLDEDRRMVFDALRQGHIFHCL